MKKNFTLLFLIILVASCEKNEEMTPPVTKQNITGFVQKGPYINGSTITVSELTTDLSATGRNFNSEIMDNKGTFTLSDLELESSFVELRANGFYFNEVLGENSSAQLSLSAITDLTDATTINVNILSSLEKNRVRYLLNSGLSFSAAKSQAEKEILKIFSISDTIRNAEFLDITKPENDNSILLAISSIMQGRRTTAELSELIANISNDIKEDGVLNDTILQTELINHAKYLNPELIRENLNIKYGELNEAVEIPELGKYIDLFIDSTQFTFTGLIKYPETGIHGENLLALDSKDTIQLQTETTYSLRALPSNTGIVKVVIHFYEDDTDIHTPGGWEVNSLNSGWLAEWISIEDNVLGFYDKEDRSDLDCNIRLINHFKADISVYEYDFENPSRIIHVQW